MTIRVKRVYEPPSDDDGYRILVDRIWPRGMAKDRATIDLWLRDVGPSTQLRTWFGHDVARWPAFRERYRQELEAKTAELDRIAEAEREHGTVTLVFSARDEEHNQAVVLAELLGERT